MCSKNVFIEENNLSDSIIKSYNMVFKKVLPLEEVLNKDLKDFNYDELLQLLSYIKSTSYQSINVKWTLIKKYLDFNNNLNYTKITQEDLKQYIENKALKYVTRKQLLDAININLDNAQDKAILILLFEGVMGKAYNDLLTLEVADIDFENNQINLNGKILNIHETTTDILNKARLQKSYDKLGDSVQTADSRYDLNMKSDYIIRSKPSSRTKNGLAHIKESGIKSRLDKIIKLLNMEGLTGLSIYHSGLIEKFIKLEKESGKTFTKTDISNTLKELDIKRIEPHQFFRAIKQVKSQNNIA